jgi:hypothetical protein
MVLGRYIAGITVFMNFDAVDGHLPILLSIPFLVEYVVFPAVVKKKMEWLSETVLNRLLGSELWTDDRIVVNSTNPLIPNFLPFI